MSCPSNKWGDSVIFRCVSCQKEYEIVKGLYTCENCGPLYGTLEVIYDYGQIHAQKKYSKTGSLFQFSDLLPVGSNTPLDEYVGGTPLIKFPDTFGVKELLIKFDGISFSGSYKDRASIIAINKAIDEGYDHIFCASTGNAGSSLALLNAHTDLETSIFVPSTIPKGKLAQLKAAGAHVHLIDASYDTVFDLSLEIGLKNGWYSRHSAINPFLLEGKKTAAFEIIVQNDYLVPDYCFVGVGDGTVMSSLLKGFHEFKEIGLIDSVPTVIGVQAEGSNTLKKVYEAGPPYVAINEEVYTIADSISVGNPRDVIKACIYLERYKGKMIEVSDGEILDAIHLLASRTGVFAEPAGAVSLAGLLKIKDTIEDDASVCLVITGNGLKDTDAILSNSEEIILSIDELKERYGES